MAMIDKARRCFGAMLSINSRVSIAMGMLALVIISEAALGQIHQFNS